MRNRIIGAIISCIFYTIIYLIYKSGFLNGQFGSNFSSVIEWTTKRVLLWIIVLSFMLAIFGKFKLLVSAICGYIVGIILGGIIGNNYYQMDKDLLEKQIADAVPPLQRVIPYHYGWAIWMGVFLLFLLVGTIIEYRYKIGRIS